MATPSNGGMTLGKILKIFFLNLIIVVGLMFVAVPVFAEILGVAFGKWLQDGIMAVLGHMHAHGKAVWLALYVALVLKDFGALAWAAKKFKADANAAQAH